MRKTTYLFLTMFMLALSWQSMAQIVPIGSGTSTQMQPLANYYGYERTADLYLADEINTDGAITALSWDVEAIGSTHPVKIYLATTSETTFNEESYDDVLSAFNPTLVYDGEIEQTSTSGLVSLTLDTPFIYDGTDNLVVIIENNVGGSGSDSFDGTRVTYTSDNTDKHIFWRRDNNPPSDDGTLNGNRSNIQLDFSPPPTCLPPTDLVVSNISLNTVDVDWTVGATETSWNISWGMSGYTPGDSDEVDTATVTTSDYRITGLDGETAYEVYVQSDCGEDDLSVWVGPLTVFTGYCQPTTTGNSSHINSFTAEGDLGQNISNLNTGEGLDGNGYSDYSDQIVEVSGNGEIEVTIEVDGTNTSGLQIWVDWDNNLIFDETNDELVHETTGYSNSHTVAFTVPTNESGSYRMRVGTSYTPNSGPDSACAHSGQGEFEDYTITVIPVSCVSPTDLIVSSVTTSSAELTWTAGGDEAQWEVLYGEAGFDLETEGDVVVVNEDAETVLDNLDPSTSYEFYVRAICDEEDASAWAGPKNFLTLCGSVSTLPYIEDFDTYGTGAEAYPNCWTRVSYVAGLNVWPSIVSYSSSPSSPNSLRFQSEVDTPTYAISPAFAEDISDLRVTFMLRREGASSGTIDVGVMSDPSDLSTFELVETIDQDNAVWEEFVFDLDQVSTSGTDNHIAFRHNSNSSIYYYWLDDFEVDYSPTCLSPTDLAISNISLDTADITWTPSDNDQAEWEVKYGETGFDIETEGAVVVVSEDAEVTLENLNDSTSYEVYVRAICNEEDESSWTGPEAFSTLCSTVTLPWEEGFESGATGQNIIPGLLCWSEEFVNQEESWKFVSANGNSTITPRSGSLMAEFRVGTFSQPTTKLITPPMDLTAISNAELTFYFANVAWGTDIDHLKVYYKKSASDEDWTLIEGAEYTTEHSDWEKVELTLPEATAAADYQIAFEAIAGYARGLNLDDISVTGEPVVVCEAVTDVAVSDITETTATVTWTASETAAEGYVVEVYESGSEELLSSLDVEHTETFVEFEELTPDTTYDVYVIAQCDEDTVEVSEVISFTTKATASVGDFNAIKLTVYPNPTSTELNLLADKTIEEVQVINILGQKVMSRKYNSAEITLDVVSLPTATYMLKVKVDGAVKTVKFIKN